MSGMQGGCSFQCTMCVFFLCLLVAVFVFILWCKWKEDSGGVSRQQKAISRPTYHTLAYLTHILQYSIYAMLYYRTCNSNTLTYLTLGTRFFLQGVDIPKS